MKSIEQGSGVKSHDFNRLIWSIQVCDEPYYFEVSSIIHLMKLFQLITVPYVEQYWPSVILIVSSITCY